MLATRKRNELEEIEIQLLLEGVVLRYGYDFREFEYAWLRPRLRAFAKAEGLRRMSELQLRVLREEPCLERLLLALAPAPEPLFADPPFYRAFRANVVPFLKTYPSIRLWQIGCAHGSEAWSLAILLEEEGLYGRTRIYATDLSEGLLDSARRGSFDASEKNYLAAGGRQRLSAHGTSSGSRLVLNPSLKRNIVFATHHLATDASFNEFNVILCRGVLEAFRRPLKARVHGLMHGSLPRLGILALGRGEALADSPHESCYERLQRRLPLYRRVR